MHGIKADATDLVALLLQRHVKPVLLLHRVALAFVVASCISLLGLFLRGVVECLADDDSARCAGGCDEGIAIGDFVAEIRSARAECDVANGTRGGATGEEASKKSK